MSLSRRRPPLAMHFLTFVALATLSTAFQFPSWIPFVNSVDPQSILKLPQIPTDRIAIVGAGAAGSSAAFWISKAKERYGLDVEIDIYDKSSLIGGRSTVVHPHEDSSLVPMELGASIFVRANKNLWRATHEFNLTRVDFEDAEVQDDETGIWDGEEFVLRVGSGKGWVGSWWNTLKVVWRYGFRAPTKTQAIVDEMIKRFVTLYGPSFGVSPWTNVTAVASQLEWTNMVAQTASEYLDAQGVDRRFTRELVEAATRVNYGQDVDKIHTIEGLVSMAASGASSVAGGNLQIFEKFVEHSKATVHLNTTVTAIERDTTNHWLLRTSSGDSRQYRAVILAAPFHSTSISLPPTLASSIPEQPYVKLHVTLLATTSSTSNSARFGLQAKDKVPRTVLTTAEGIRQGKKAPEFNSMTFHGKIGRKDGEERDVEEHLVKVFSDEKVEDDWLEEMFGKGQVTWTYRRLFEAYPVLPPTTTFPPIKLDEGLYYVNAFEPLISTMETETIASRNVISLLLNDLYNSAICKLDLEDEETIQKAADPNYVYGWDC
ncbi:hypothetical protein EIP91_009628 [Steccherinum ochraceum]|uniref:Prenylcysteine lyase domain-containing protein n=1 Tax=Steccherinum ochraceum TaxID=92696 RepID=A0A4R0R1F9_9APHY|nr:hypothetical protein EIP91_009628 [Steccherinum ochraceum]